MSLYNEYQKMKQNPTTLDDLAKFDKQFKHSTQIAFSTVWRSPYSQWTDNKWDVNTTQLADDLQVWFNLVDDERTDQKWIRTFQCHFLE